MTATKQIWAKIANASIANEINALSPDAREYFEERAGIHQHEGDMTQTDAESLALAQTYVIFPTSRAEDLPF